MYGSKFFGKPSAKPAPQQTTLSFSTKAPTKPKTETEESTAGTEASSSRGKAQDDDEDAPVKAESASPPATTKKRTRSSPATKAKASPAPVKAEAEAEAEAEEEEEEAPVTKRPRRGRPRVVEEDDGDEAMPDAEPVKPARAAKGDKKGPAKQASSPGAELSALKIADAKGSPQKATSASAAARQKSKKDPEPESEAPAPAESTASESASEVDEDGEDEEEKKTEAKKARQKMQSKLMDKPAKDPYPDWKEGTPVPYAALCTTFSLIELTSKRLEIIEHCSLFLRQVLRLTPGDFLPTVLLMINKLAPDYAGIELGIGESLIMKAIGETTGRSLQVIKQDQKEIGDLGLVAVKSRSTQPTMFKPKPLTVSGVHKGLMGIATVTGNGAQGRKVDGIKKLLSAADSHSAGKIDIAQDKGGPSEAKFIIRFLEGKLRLGLAEKSVLVAIAQAVCIHEAGKKGTVPSPSDMDAAEQLLKTVYR